MSNINGFIVIYHVKNQRQKWNGTRTSHSIKSSSLVYKTCYVSRYYSNLHALLMYKRRIYLLSHALPGASDCIPVFYYGFVLLNHEFSVESYVKHCLRVSPFAVGQLGYVIRFMASDDPNVACIFSCGTVALVVFGQFSDICGP